MSTTASPNCRYRRRRCRYRIMMMMMTTMIKIIIMKLPCGNNKHLHIPDGKSRPEDHGKDSTMTTHTTAAAIELCFDGCRTMYQFLRQHLLLSFSLNTTTALAFPSTSAAATAFMTNDKGKMVDDNSHDKRPHKKQKLPRTLKTKNRSSPEMIIIIL